MPAVGVIGPPPVLTGPRRGLYPGLAGGSFQNARPVAEQGFKTILSGPAHPPYGRFCPAPGHQFGFNDLKTLEAGAFLHEVAGGPKAGPDFGQALEFERVIHAIAASAREQRRVTL
jgi:predicted dehydrogenase